jgi:Cu(I)/Ag(I) efflux system protein CusF
MKRISAFLLAAVVGASALAQTLADGEVQKVDKAAGKVTLKHGELEDLKMPPMTMVFIAKDKAILDKVKKGDKVRFVAAQEGKNLVVTRIEKK